MRIPAIFATSLNIQNNYQINRKRDFYQNTQYFGNPIIGLDSVEFCAQGDFEKLFNKTFFKKLLKEGLPCAYTGTEMIPRSFYDECIKQQLFNKRASVVIRELKPYKHCFFDVEKKIFNLLEKESKKHPDLKIQELLKLKYSHAEKTLIQKQSQTLDKISIISRNLPKNEHLEIRKYVSKAFDKIFEQDFEPEKRFRRKEFITGLKRIKISDPKIQKKIIDYAQSLPKSTDSVEAFIVKYSQDSTIKIVNGKIKTVKRDSQDLGLRLLKPSLGTDEHIYPKTLYKKDNKKDDLWVKILTSDYINNLKNDKLIDDLISESNFDIKTNIQNHINRLIEILEKWDKNGKYEDAKTLANYIIVLKEEFSKRSNIIDINIENVEQRLSELVKKSSLTSEKIAIKKRIKSVGRADNTHGEHYVENGVILENRKIQIPHSRLIK